MWNQHVIRGQPTVEGHGGGIPDVLFNHPVMSATVLGAEHPTEDPMYAELRGQLREDALGRLTVDETTRYGADNPSAFETEDDMVAESLQTQDPLQQVPMLQKVRDHYIVSNPLILDLHVAATSSAWDKMQIYVQRYIQYKVVCKELLACVLHHMGSDGTFDWCGFEGDSTPDTLSVRTDLAATGRALG